MRPPLPLGPRRSAGTNPRAKGTNPRAKGTNPRATKTSPRYMTLEGRQKLAEWERRRQVARARLAAAEAPLRYEQRAETHALAVELGVECRRCDGTGWEPAPNGVRGVVRCECRGSPSRTVYSLFAGLLDEGEDEVPIMGVRGKVCLGFSGGR